LKALAKTGGVIQVVAYNTYLKPAKPDSPERTTLIAALRNSLGLPLPTAPGGSGGEFQSAVGRLSAEGRAEYLRRLAVIDGSYPASPGATVADLVNHIDYIVKLIGIDHVGISSDFDGGGGITGWRDASETFNVTLELVKRGYSEAQIAKIWSGNLLRVMDKVQEVAKGLQKKTQQADLKRL